MAKKNADPDYLFLLNDLVHSENINNTVIFCPNDLNKAAFDYFTYLRVLKSPDDTQDKNDTSINPRSLLQEQQAKFSFGNQLDDLYLKKTRENSTKDRAERGIILESSLERKKRHVIQRETAEAVPEYLNGSLSVSAEYNAPLVYWPIVGARVLVAIDAVYNANGIHAEGYIIPFLHLKELRELYEKYKNEPDLDIYNDDSLIKFFEKKTNIKTVRSPKDKLMFHQFRSRPCRVKIPMMATTSTPQAPNVSKKNTKRNGTSMSDLLNIDIEQRLEVPMKYAVQNSEKFSQIRDVSVGDIVLCEVRRSRLEESKEPSVSSVVYILDLFFNCDDHQDN